MGLASIDVALTRSPLWPIATDAVAIQTDKRRLRINRIIVQDAPGRRATPVAPNSRTGYRGYEVRECLVRIQTNQGIEGVAHTGDPANRKEVLQKLIGVNPFDLVQWKDSRYAGPSEQYHDLVSSLRSIDVAIFDILANALQCPLAEVLGEQIRDSVDVYDSSLYMEDLLKPEERVDLAYLRGKEPPRDGIEMVARKAEWLINSYYRVEGVRIFKMKTGRAKWMASYEEALRRDIAVFRAVRDAVGPHYTLLVDVNNGYEEDPTAGKRFIEETTDAGLFGLEEMFGATRVDEHRAVMEYANSLGLNVRDIDGETDGIPPHLYAETIKTSRGPRPLFAINNPAFDRVLGFVQMSRIAKDCGRYGIQLGPHNFASKIGFYTSVHLGFSAPNWAYAEMDDSEFPGIRCPGIDIRNGRASLTGLPGLGIELVSGQLDAPQFVIE